MRIIQPNRVTKTVEIGVPTHRLTKVRCSSRTWIRRKEPPCPRPVIPLVRVILRGIVPHVRPELLPIVVRRPPLFAIRTIRAPAVVARPTHAAQTVGRHLLAFQYVSNVGLLHVN